MGEWRVGLDDSVRDDDDNDDGDGDDCDRKRKKTHLRNSGDEMITVNRGHWKNGG